MQFYDKSSWNSQSNPGAADFELISLLHKYYMTPRDFAEYSCGSAWVRVFFIGFTFETCHYN